jgi:hypothetical protein
MLPFFSRRALLSVALLLVLRLAAAQTGWQQLYTGPLPLSCAKALRQADGGFLLIGTEMLSRSGSSSLTSRRLYLLRTDAQGHQQWERRLTVPGLDKFLVLDAAQTAQGELLLGLAVFEPQVIGSRINYLAQVSPQGQLRWTRDFVGTSTWIPGLAADKAHDGFVVPRNSLTGAELLYLSLNGQQRLQVPVAPLAPAFRTSIDAVLARGEGVVLATNSYSNAPTGGMPAREARLVQVSDMGVRGAETLQPDPLEYIVRMLPLDDNSFLTYGTTYHRVTLGNNGLVWTRQVETGKGMLTPSAWAANAAGDVLVYGFASQNSHTTTRHLGLLDANTGQVRTLPPNGLPAMRQLGSQIPAGVAPSAPTIASLFPGDAPNAYFVAGTLPNGVFLASGSFEELDLNATDQLQAWPNPISGNELLQVGSTFAAAHPLYLYDLQGHQLMSWPAVPGGAAQLSLRGLQPGVYVLVGTNGQGKTDRLRILKR